MNTRLKIKSLGLIYNNWGFFLRAFRFEWSDFFPLRSLAYFKRIYYWALLFFLVFFLWLKIRLSQKLSMKWLTSIWLINWTLKNLILFLVVQVRLSLMNFNFYVFIQIFRWFIKYYHLVVNYLWKLRVFFKHFLYKFNNLK